MQRASIFVCHNHLICISIRKYLVVIPLLYSKHRRLVHCFVQFKDKPYPPNFRYAHLLNHGIFAGIQNLELIRQAMIKAFPCSYRCKEIWIESNNKIFQKILTLFIFPYFIPVVAALCSWVGHLFQPSEKAIYLMTASNGSKVSCSRAQPTSNHLTFNILPGMTLLLSSSSILALDMIQFLYGT